MESNVQDFFETSWLYTSLGSIFLLVTTVDNTVDVLSRRLFIVFGVAIVKLFHVIWLQQEIFNNNFTDIIFYVLELDPFGYDYDRRCCSL